MAEIIEQSNNDVNYKAINSCKSFPEIRKTIKNLGRDVKKYQWIGVSSMVVIAITLIVTGTVVFNLFAEALKDAEKIKTNDNWAPFIIILVLRTSVLGSLIVSFVVYTFRFTTSCFDQSVRFTKRKHATLFLLEVAEHIKLEKENIGIIMTAFREWNVSVESAFTELKVDAKFAKLFKYLGKPEDIITDMIKDTVREEFAKARTGQKDSTAAK